MTTVTGDQTWDAWFKIPNASHLATADSFAVDIHVLDESKYIYIAPHKKEGKTTSDNILAFIWLV